MGDMDKPTLVVQVEANRDETSAPIELCPLKITIYNGDPKLLDILLNGFVHVDDQGEVRMCDNMQFTTNIDNTLPIIVFHCSHEDYTNLRRQIHVITAEYEGSNSKIETRIIGELPSHIIKHTINYDDQRELDVSSNRNGIFYEIIPEVSSVRKEEVFYKKDAYVLYLHVAGWPDEGVWPSAINIYGEEFLAKLGLELDQHSCERLWCDEGENGVQLVDGNDLYTFCIDIGFATKEDMKKALYILEKLGYKLAIPKFELSQQIDDLIIKNSGRQT